ncbi:hypothetical protein DX887_23190 [Vibrio alginolyticus]|uniref:hypothetical protein n=1 Tax=Vibrio sp. 2-1(7) TaxID=2591011 RepID=UPI001482F47F|nr:hypothetical protein [Vibrio sp. 2-1(7)]EGR2558700.1 hypothetical protein [Vibrio alginolyticus]EHC9866289.1 hypothetical protein [Vibrio alginolyticus]EJS0322121.1 hypothetical protein [Vibrio alginolyticus]ELA7834363.1 hypothetical protein [Vibrio alginolyticus]ELB2909111.1 hypothetical protein [Vibrio alginolyticus]
MIVIWKQFYDCALSAAHRIDDEAPFYVAFGDTEAVSAIIMSVTAIEAYLNELADVIGMELGRTETDLAILHESLLLAETKRESIEAKARIVCEYSGGKYDPSRKPVQDFELLIQLRNSLTHYKTHNTSNVNQPIKLLRKLRSKGILLGRSQEALSSPAYSWSHEVCTKQAAFWAAETCLAMVTFMSSNLDIRIKNIVTGFLALEVENA